MLVCVGTAAKCYVDPTYFPFFALIQGHSRGWGSRATVLGTPTLFPSSLTLIRNEPVGPRALPGAFQDLLQCPVEKLGLLQAVLPAEGSTLILGHGIEGLQWGGILHCTVPELQGWKKKT